MTTSVLIIGFGSGIRGDDALGPRAAERLEQHFEHDQDVRVLSRASLTPELSADVADASLVLFVDCAATGPVGELVEQPVALVDEPSVAMVHFLNPTGLLYWVKQLYDKEPQAVMLSVAGETFEISDGLSPTMAAALPRVVDRVVTLVADYRHASLSHA